jgi:diguanylate cyclase (GGDEF)-like protein
VRARRWFLGATALMTAAHPLLPERPRAVIYLLVSAITVLLFRDLNGFKAVNDRLGHLAGDQLLTEVGGRIRRGLRAGETVARYGGDEFLVLCADDAPQEAARRLRAHIERVMAEPFGLPGDLRVGAAVGAVLSDGRSGADELIRRADQAMYAAKEASRSALP